MLKLISVLFNESKLLKCQHEKTYRHNTGISVLFNESKLLKFRRNGAMWMISIIFQYSSTSRNC